MHIKMPTSIAEVFKFLISDLASVRIEFMNLSEVSIIGFSSMIFCPAFAFLLSYYSYVASFGLFLIITFIISFI